MNIFQLISHDRFHQAELGLNHLHTNWAIFLQHINRLSNASQQQMANILKDGAALWYQIQTNTPNIMKMLRDYYIYFLQNTIKNNLELKLQKIVGTTSKSSALKLFDSINQIHQLYFAHYRYIEIIDENLIIITQFTNSLIKLIQKFNLSDSFYLVLQEAYYKNVTIIFTEDIIDFDSQIKQYIQSTCTRNNQYSIDFNLLKIILENLNSMRLLEKFFERTYYMLVRACEEFLINTSNLPENSKFLSNTLNYHRTFQKSYLKKLKTSNTESLLLSYGEQLEENIYFLCSKYCSKNILQIIIDYPKSQGVVIVLKKCLDKSNLLNELSQKLYQGVKKRLLIPGVITPTILVQYLSILKVLQIIDPHGIVFEKMTVPIKNYLLKRNDTLRCIISHMTENGQISTGLTHDMIRIPSKQYIDEESSDENQKAAEHWQILNVKQSKMRIRVKYQQIDLATVLVNLYGSQQAFITQYQNMLAQKLMSARDYNLQEQIKNIELLKMRFGENALQMCNVIIKDVRDSKKNDTVVHKQLGGGFSKNSQLTLDQMNCLAVSKGYWPINYENTSSFQIPEAFKQVFNLYADKFSKLKSMRKIQYHYNLGHVNLTLSFKNGNFDFKCLPIHAVLINYFDEQKMKDSVNGISSEELSQHMHISPTIVKQKMSFWVHKGVIKQIRQQKTALTMKRIISTTDETQSVSYKPVQQYTFNQRQQIDEDADQFVSNQNTSMQGHLKHIIEGLIISILNTNGPKSPEKIHLLLKTIYKTDLDYAYQEAQTIQILKKMAQKKKIAFNGETYSTRVGK